MCIRDSLRLAVLIQYRSVMDTQTHRHTTTAYTALSKASRGKNRNNSYKTANWTLNQTGGLTRHAWNSVSPRSVLMAQNSSFGYVTRLQRQNVAYFEVAGSILWAIIVAGRWSRYSVCSRNHAFHSGWRSLSEVCWLRCWPLHWPIQTIRVARLISSVTLSVLGIASRLSAFTSCLLLFYAWLMTLDDVALL